MNREPELVVVEEPEAIKRFRYRREGRGSPLVGKNSTTENRTYPSIKILGYTGTVRVLVSCVTEDKPYRQHPHDIVGQNCDDYGVYRNDFSADSNHPTIISFSDLRISCTIKSNFESRLRQRRRQGMNIKPFDFIAGDDFIRDTHTVRLCFEVFYRPDPLRPDYISLLAPKFSQPIANRRDSAEVHILDIGTKCSPASGGEKIMIFSNKITKNDIAARIFEVDAKENEIWSGLCHSYNVHKGVAISFKTPAYKSTSIDEPRNVFIELFRPSDNARSEPEPFQYDRDATNIDSIILKKQHKIDKSRIFLETNEMQAIYYNANARNEASTMQQPCYQPPQQSHYQSPQQLCYQPPRQPSYQLAQQPSYQPPKQSYQSPQQPSYHPPEQSYQPRLQLSYQPPQQPSYQLPLQLRYQPPQQPSYHQPPEQSYQPTQQPSYQSLQQASYKPPQQLRYQPSQQPSYHQPPEQSYQPTQQPSYQSPQQASYKPPQQPYQPHHQTPSSSYNAFTDNKVSNIQQHSCHQPQQCNVQQQPNGHPFDGNHDLDILENLDTEKLFFWKN